MNEPRALLMVVSDLEDFARRVTKRLAEFQARIESLEAMLGVPGASGFTEVMRDPAMQQAAAPPADRGY